jgi:hypothetical protein
MPILLSHTANDEGNNLFGFHTLSNGVTFFGIKISALRTDEEPYIFAALYYDGEKVKCYTPVRGNAINAKYMVAIGHEASAIYQMTGTDFLTCPLDVDDIEEVRNAYLAKYDLTYDTIVQSWDAIQEELEAVFYSV